MPVNKLNLDLPKYSYLKPLVDNRLKIVEEYNEMKTNPEYTNHFFVQNWNLLCLQNIREGVTDNIKNFPVISEFIDNLPDNKKMITLVVSVMKYGDTVWHAEEWTRERGFYRIHIPLNNVEGASIAVEEEGGEVINYTYELGNAYQFANPYDMHKPSNYNESGNTRLLVMIDLIDSDENPEVDDELLQSKYPIEMFTTAPT